MEHLSKILSKLKPLSIPFDFIKRNILLISFALILCLMIGSCVINEIDKTEQIRLQKEMERTNYEEANTLCTSVIKPLENPSGVRHFHCIADDSLIVCGTYCEKK